MKSAPSQDLARLPSEAAVLVSQGVYSLYEIRSASAKYMLVTNKRGEFYLLNERGEVVGDPSVKSIGDVDIVDAIALHASEARVLGNGLAISIG
jgi:hypothetical protein